MFLPHHYSRQTVALARLLGNIPLGVQYQRTIFEHLLFEHRSPNTIYEHLVLKAPNLQLQRDECLRAS